MPKILLLTTGGTIASVPTKEGLAPGLGAQQLLSYVPAVTEKAEIIPKQLLSLDSTNLQPEHWITMATEIYQSLPHYDGIVVTHGTDTMAYTAAALSFMLPDVPLPVVLTGAQIPIHDPQSDGPKNLTDALLVAMAGHPGISLVFNGQIIKGCRASKIDTVNFDAFASINYPPIGFIKDGKVHFAQDIKSTCLQRNAQLDTKLDQRVLLLKLVPGLNPAIVTALPQLGFKGLVIEGFGNGGVPFYGKHNLLPAVQEVISKGVQVVVSTQCLNGGTHLELYEVGRKTAALGALSGHDMTTEALVTKLMWVLGHTTEPAEVKKMMLHNYCEEISYPSQ
ncbi:MAG: asparaginase [bacterium]